MVILLVLMACVMQKTADPIDDTGAEQTEDTGRLEKILVTLTPVIGYDDTEDTEEEECEAVYDQTIHHGVIEVELVKVPFGQDRFPVSFMVLHSDQTNSGSLDVVSLGQDGLLSLTLSTDRRWRWTRPHRI